MNQKIKQLANQAKSNVPSGLEVDQWVETYNQIFAELIVRECAKFTDHTEELYKHFGVEE